MRNLTPTEQDKQLRLLAQLVFYGDSSSLLAIDAHELFRICSARRIRESMNEFLEFTISDICNPLSILEDKTVSFRNRHFAANPDHFLLRTLESLLQRHLEQLMISEPSAALERLVSLTLSRSNETLIRNHHKILRDEFITRAAQFPGSAGRALKKLIQYCGYSQIDDEMYRKELCQESFDLLLPVLESISPDDAAFAKTGIGRSPRYFLDL